LAKFKVQLSLSARCRRAALAVSSKPRRLLQAGYFQPLKSNPLIIVDNRAAAVQSHSPKHFLLAESFAPPFDRLPGCDGVRRPAVCANKKDDAKVRRRQVMRHQVMRYQVMRRQVMRRQVMRRQVMRRQVTRRP
jgi:hypothetical protein